MDIKKKLLEFKNEIPKNPNQTINTYKISGRIINSGNLESIKGADITIPGNKFINTKSKEDGSFLIYLVIPVNNKDNSVSQPIFLKVSYPNLAPKLKPLLDSNNRIKTNLGTIQLLNVEDQAEETSLQLKSQALDIINKSSNLVLSPEESSIIVLRGLINKQLVKTQTDLFPLISGILISLDLNFDSPQSKCPDKNGLKNIINTRNNITTQINQIFRTITINSSLALTLQIISKLFQTVEISVSTIPLPLGAPLGVGIPYNLVSTIQNIENQLISNGEQVNNISKNIILSLIFLLTSLISLNLYLSTIDKALEDCITQGGYNEFELEEINEEITRLSQEQSLSSLETNNNVVFYKGHKISVIDTNTQVGSLRRRQAIAKNSQGVIMLKGNPSFSSSDNILIEELKYFIDTNNIKTF